MMCLHERAQRKAQEEIGKVIGSDRLPTFADMADLPYVGACVKETLRYWTIAPLGIIFCQIPGSCMVRLTLCNSLLQASHIAQCRMIATRTTTSLQVRRLSRLFIMILIPSPGATVLANIWYEPNHYIFRDPLMLVFIPIQGHYARRDGLLRSILLQAGALPAAKRGRPGRARLLAHRLRIRAPHLPGYAPRGVVAVDIRSTHTRGAGHQAHAR